jgi:hypothetical protein
MRRILALFTHLPRKTRLEQREDAFMAVLDRLVEAQTRQVEAQNASIVALVSVLATQMAAYSSPSSPESWVVGEQDEILAEMRRRGMPEGDAKTQLQWVLDSSGR